MVRERKEKILPLPSDKKIIDTVGEASVKGDRREGALATLPLTEVPAVAV